MNSVERVTGTAKESDGLIVHWQHRAAACPEFNEQVFEDQWLTANGYVVNSPSAGRGASLFLNIDEHKLVLRHYRRGGMVRSVSEKSYLWLGLQRTRAWNEFDVLCSLERMGLPSPRPYACQVKRSGLIYSATLITYYMDGLTLAERVCSAELTPNQWFDIGACISTFHAAGVNHADLNAHNILFDDAGKVSIIDFDRATINQFLEKKRFENNLKRLHRSLRKIESSGPAHFNDQCWDALMSGYSKI